MRSRSLALFPSGAHLILAAARGPGSNRPDRALGARGGGKPGDSLPPRYDHCRCGRARSQARIAPRLRRVSAAPHRHAPRRWPSSAFGSNASRTSNDLQVDVGSFRWRCDGYARSQPREFCRRAARQRERGTSMRARRPCEARTGHAFTDPPAKTRRDRAKVCSRPDVSIHGELRHRSQEDVRQSSPGSTQGRRERGCGCDPGLRQRFVDRANFNRRSSKRVVRPSSATRRSPRSKPWLISLPSKARNSLG
jgi:hypothetical protein